MSTPSAHDVEVVISQLECDEKEATALRTFYNRERRHPKLTGKMLRVALWWAFIALTCLWVGWTLVDAAFDWLWRGLGVR